MAQVREGRNVRQQLRYRGAARALLGASSVVDCTTAAAEVPVERFQLGALDVRLFNLGGTSITLFSLAWALLLGAALVVVARLLRAWTVQRLLVHTDLDLGTRQ